MIEKIDDLLNKKTKSLKYDADRKFKQILKEREEQKHQQLRATIQEFRQKVLDSGRDMRFIFQKMDLDGNGVLSPLEIKSAFLLLGIGMFYNNQSQTNL